MTPSPDNPRHVAAEAPDGSQVLVIDFGPDHPLHIATRPDGWAVWGAPMKIVRDET